MCWSFALKTKSNWFAACWDCLCVWRYFFWPNLCFTLVVFKHIIHYNMEVVLRPFYLDGVSWNVMKTSFPRRCLLLRTLTTGRTVRMCPVGSSESLLLGFVILIEEPARKSIGLASRSSSIYRLYLSLVSACVTLLRTLSLKFTSRFYCSDHSQSNCSVQDLVKICSESLCLLGDFNNYYDNNR